MGDNFNIKFDLSELEKEFSFFKDINKRLEKSIEILAAQAHTQAIKLAQEKLKSRRDTYLQNLELKVEGSGSERVYVLILHEPAMWIEEGVVAHSMKSTHLNGKDQVVIPFQHNKGQQSMMPPKQQQLFNDVKSFLKKEKMNMSKPIVNSAGKPILSSPGNVNAAKTFGQVPSSIASKKSGQSVLNNLSIYQREVTGKGGQKSIKKDIMTFRTLSKNSSNDEWNVPDLKPQLIMDEVYSWIIENYERIISESLVDIVARGS